MNVKFKGDISHSLKLPVRPNYFGINIQEVVFWTLTYGELKIFFKGKKKAITLTKNCTTLGGEANFYALLQILGAEFQDSEEVISQFTQQQQDRTNAISRLRY